VKISAEIYKHIMVENSKKDKVPEIGKKIVIGHSMVSARKAYEHLRTS